MSKIFMIHKVEPFEVKIFNSRVSMRSEREEFSIVINGRKSAQKLLKSFFHFLSARNAVNKYKKATKIFTLNCSLWLFLNFY